MPHSVPHVPHLPILKLQLEITSFFDAINSIDRKLPDERTHPGQNKRLEDQSSLSTTILPLPRIGGEGSSEAVLGK